MKKILTIGVLFILSGMLLGSCVKDDSCKTCKQNKYTNGTLTSEGTAVEYCGSELTDIESEEPVTINGVTTQYDCQ